MDSPIKHIYFRDLVLLRVIAETADELSGVHYSNMTNLGNAWLTRYAIPVYYSRPFSHSMSQHQITLNVLITSGLVGRVGSRKGFNASDSAFELFDTLGANWREWPISIPVYRGELQMDKAVYAQEMREEL